MFFPGNFSTDSLEKDISKFREGSGGTYFISVKKVIEKLKIRQASTILFLDVTTYQMDVNSGPLCKFTLCEEGCEVFENIPALEDSIPVDTKKSSVYIAGYVTFSSIKWVKLSCCLWQLSITRCMEDMWIIWRGLKIHADSACQWTFFCYTLFQYLNSKVYRKYLFIKNNSVVRFWHGKGTHLHFE